MTARRRRTRTAPEIPFDRFVDGFSRLTDPPIVVGPQPKAPDVVFDIIRPADLLALRVEVFDLELHAGDEPVLVTGDDPGYLIVHLAFQHIAERAIYETKVDPPVPDDHADPNPPETSFFLLPEQARPAKGSRIVLEVPANHKISFTTEGILQAVTQLPMAVHPLATPRPYAPIPPQGPIFGLGDGLVAIGTDNGLVVAPVTSRRRAPDPGTVTGLNQLMRDRRIARAINVRLGTTHTRTVDVDRDAGDVTVSIGGRDVGITSLIGRGGLIGSDLPIARGTTPKFSREPRQFETSIEAPYRLMISPSQQGGWKHALAPVGADGAEHRVELWHSRLGVRREGRDGSVAIDENTTHQRIIRAVWARDREAMADFTQELKPAHVDTPFRSSLDGADRHMLVRQSSETWIGASGQRINPEPVEARNLYVSSLGAWLNFHGAWDTDPYSDGGLMSSIESWDHIAPMGRDQFVKVVYPGYLWPFGHRASLVKLTERKMKHEFGSIAGLYQRMFLVIKEPVKRYNQRDLPLTEVRVVPLVTPTLDPPPSGDDFDTAFVPMVDGVPFTFILHARDHEDRALRLATPLTWVAAANLDGDGIRAVHAPHATVAFDGQKLAFAEVSKGGDTIAPAAAVTFDATPQVGKSVPEMVTADITIDAVEQLSSAGPVAVQYFKTYVEDGFGGSNEGEVWAKLTAAVDLGFGAGQSSGSDKAGGFIQPNLKVAGLSRINGTVNDLANIAAGDFKPAQFLDGILPRLFGLVDLIDILELVGLDLDDAPAVISETLDRIEAFLDDLQRAKKAVEDAVAEADKLRTRAATKAQELQDAADDAFQAAADLKSLVDDAVDSVAGTIAGLIDATEEAVEQAMEDPLNALRAALAEIKAVAPLLPPLIRNQLQKLADILQLIVDAADLISDIVRFVNGLGSSSAQFSYRYEWKPKMKSWPDENDPVLELQTDSLVIAVEGRINGKGEMGVDALAELKDFALNLLPGAELVSFKFDHLSFKGGTGGKAEVDVVINDIEFLGLLGFIEVLKELIPFDGFSDPPYLDVTASGLEAGFTQDLPNVAIGVFNLSNLSLGADIQVPFLGEMVTVGFNFCTRERPFTLAVLFIGGGGFFGIRLSPEGLVVLELSLEAGAVLAVDFGVASGSVSAMLGIYMRLEGDAGSLAGYFRLRGEVDVLGLISASIELYLELLYDFATGKMVGRASLTVKVEVLFFSASVTIEAERQFAGSNGDPNFVDVMGLEADGTSPAWSEYCLAFAGA